MTALDIFDSAIKIGLGALIAGLSAYFLAKAQHANSLQKDKVDREFELLKEVAEKVERFTTAALRFWSLAGDWRRIQQRTPDTPLPKTLTEAQATLYANFNELTSAEALLLLLGHEDAQVALRKYGDLVVSFSKESSVVSPAMKQDQVNAYRGKFLDARQTFFGLLHAKYVELSTGRK